MLPNVNNVTSLNLAYLGCATDRKYFFFILNMLNNNYGSFYFIFIHTLVHYIGLRFLRFPEGFLLYAVALLSVVLMRETNIS